LTKSETIASSPSTSTNIISNRSSSTPSNETPAKQSKQTPILQPHSQSPSTALRDQSPKLTSTGSTSSHESIGNIESSPTVTTTKTPEQVVRPITTTTTPVVQKTVPSTVKSQEKPKTVEIIPKFYFPNGQNSATSTNDTQLIKQLRQVKEELFLTKNDKLHIEDFGKLAQVETTFKIFFL